jgi:hypothetical protein
MNLLLVDSTVKDYEVFVNSVNSTTTPVVYFPHTTRQELLARLNGPIERIAVVSHTHTFIEREPIFSDLNVDLFRTMIETHQVKQIDYLACNTLQNPEWIEYFKKLPCVIGASNDLTGNLKYGGDLIMESTSEDIEAIYFTHSIEYYKYFLYDYEDENGIRYTINGLEVSVSGFDDSDVNNRVVVIPSSIIINSVTYQVTSIGPNAFFFSQLTSVTIPASVTSIGFFAFYFSKLTSVTIPASVTSIGPSAFGFSKLTSVTIPASVTSIENYAFSDTPTLVSLTIENGTTLTIGDGAFYATGLTSVTIPASVTSIGRNAFYATGLTSVTIPASVTSIGTNAFNTLTSVSITDSTATQSDTFNVYINITLYILNGTTTLQSVTPTDLSRYDLSSFSITSIGTVFNDFKTVATVFIPTNATYSGTLSNTVTLYKKAIVENATYTLLYDNTLYSVSPTNLSTYELSSLPITSIGTVFNSPSWTTTSTVFIPTNTTYSGTLSSSVTLYKKAIVENATYTLLYDNTLTSVTPTNLSTYDLSSSSITSVGTVFQGLGISSITLPSTLTTIENKAFRNCENLEEITIPSSVTSIGQYAFAGCASLTDLTIQNGSNVAIGDYAFQNCGELANVTLPKVTSIGTRVFQNCEKLDNVVLPDVTTIGESAFQNCKALDSVTFPSTAFSIGDYSFQNTALTTITVPELANPIGKFAFSCTSLNTVTFG